MASLVDLFTRGPSSPYMTHVLRRLVLRCRLRRPRVSLVVFASYTSTRVLEVRPHITLFALRMSTRIFGVRPRISLLTLRRRLASRLRLAFRPRRFIRVSLRSALSLRTLSLSSSSLSTFHNLYSISCHYRLALTWSLYFMTFMQAIENHAFTFALTLLA